VLETRNRQRWQPADGSGRGRNSLRPTATCWWRLVTAAPGRE